MYMSFVSPPLGCQVPRRKGLAPTELELQKVVSQHIGAESMSSLITAVLLMAYAVFQPQEVEF